jgi:hypothetical protein
MPYFSDLAVSTHDIIILPEQVTDCLIREGLMVSIIINILTQSIGKSHSTKAINIKESDTLSIAQCQV